MMTRDEFRRRRAALRRIIGPIARSHFQIGREEGNASDMIFQRKADGTLWFTTRGRDPNEALAIAEALNFAVDLATPQTDAPDRDR